LDRDEVAILDMDADAAKAESIKLRLSCFCSMSRPVGEQLILGATMEGTKLSVVLAEDLRISMWTLSQHRQWSQQVSISKAAIDEQLVTAGLELEAYSAIRFESFRRRSGIVLFWMAWVGLVRLDLRTKKATLLCRCSLRDTCWACLQEIDLASLFRGMKLF
jgi:hypothetical protein